MLVYPHRETLELVTSSTRSLPTVDASKTALYNHYRSALATTFNPENISDGNLSASNVTLFVT